MKASIPFKKIDGNFIHMVFFWLKKPENQDDRQKFKKSLQKFIETNPQLVGAHIGHPASTNRPVIDNSYTFSLVVTFPDLETHDAYQIDPSHVKFVEEAQSLWEKVQIYDSTTE